MYNDTSLIRYPSVAGKFYPSSPTELREVLSDYIYAAPHISDDKPIGLIAPHAGYVYSGAVAGNAYRQIIQHQYDTVIVIAPSHFLPLNYASIMPAGSYETPFGSISVDEELARELATGDAIRLSFEAHSVPANGQREHSLEVQIPFLQVALGEFKLVPIIAGFDIKLTEQLGHALSRIIRDRNVLIVASTDLSHFHSYDEATTMDSKLIKLVSTMDYSGLEEGCKDRRFEACGTVPMSALLRTFCYDNQFALKVLSYANSGDITGGTKEKVVGYLSAAIYRNQHE